jgi:hypothetical protein
MIPIFFFSKNKDVLICNQNTCKSDLKYKINVKRKDWPKAHLDFQLGELKRQHLVLGLNFECLDEEMRSTRKTSH